MPLRGRSRRLCLQLHRWLGLALALVLGLSGLTGTLLVLWGPVAHGRPPAVLPDGAPPALASALPWQSVLAQLRQAHGPQASFTFRPPRAAGETLWVFVRGPRWNGTVYFDPTSGRWLTQHAEGERAFGWLLRLHSELGAGETGKAVLAAAALGAGVLTLSGWLLWWPARWRQGLQIKWSAGGTRRLFDLHRVTGAALGGWVLVCVATGAYMAWRPLAGGLTRLAGAAPLAPPAVVPAAPGAPAMPLDAIVERAASVARAQWPGARLGYVQVPAAGQTRPVRIRWRLPDDPHPNGLSSVWLHPRTGAVLAVHRWTALDPGARAYAVVYPLHTGEWGGPPLQAAVGLGGLLLAGYGVTGIWLWLKRRRGRPRGAAGRATEAHRLTAAR